MAPNIIHRHRFRLKPVCCLGYCRCGASSYSAAQPASCKSWRTRMSKAQRHRGAVVRKFARLVRGLGVYINISYLYDKHLERLSQATICALRGSNVHVSSSVLARVFLRTGNGDDGSAKSVLGPIKTRSCLTRLREKTWISQNRNFNALTRSAGGAILKSST
jgi:hypothetical protein